MSTFVFEPLNYFKRKVLHPYVFFFSIIFFIVSLISSSLHYMNIFYGNNLSWISWIIGVVTFSYSFLPSDLSFNRVVRKIKKSDYLIPLFIVVLYAASHLWNFTTAPWNQNGLFDDAAWDIYFAKNHAFNGPFQAAFFDNVGYISREVVFHYYISIFFKLFGYNLLIFNISLLVLGFITVLFTTLLIQKMFKNVLVTILSAFIINFFPLHYMHIFMGHRYAIAAPLMIVSLYYLYTAFTNNSYARTVISAFFAAMCLDSAVMGKQYLFGLILSVPFFLFTGKHSISKGAIAIGLVWIVSFIIFASPLIIYILFNYSEYVGREHGLIQEFISSFQKGGFLALRPYWDQLREVFFTPFTFRRQFLPDFYAIPLAYYGLILPGLLIAMLKKHFEIVWLSLIPVIGALLSGAYDFRVLLAVPLWVLSMAFSIEYVLTHTFHRNLFIHRIGVVISMVFIGTGLVASIAYIWNVSKKPNYLYLLPHKDVAVSRLVQDIAVGASRPTSNMKWDELNRKIDMSQVPYDTLVSPASAYAIMHLYLQNYDDAKILSFTDQGIQQLKTQKEIFHDNIQAIQSYKPTGKDLKLVWEVSDKTNEIIDTFRKYRGYGTDKVFYGDMDDNIFNIYTLTISNKYIKQFQQDIVVESYKTNFLDGR